MSSAGTPRARRWRQITTGLASSCEPRVGAIPERPVELVAKLLPRRAFASPVGLFSSQPQTGLARVTVVGLGFIPGSHGEYPDRQAMPTVYEVAPDDLTRDVAKYLC